MNLPLGESGFFRALLLITVCIIYATVENTPWLKYSEPTPATFYYAQLPPTISFSFMSFFMK